MSMEPIDRLWVLVAAALVFQMQFGFLCLEVGMVRPRETVVQAMKNCVNWMTSVVAFFAVGFGLMFGASAAGWIGTGFFALEGLGGDSLVFFLFQLGFVGTACTIVSGALAGRVSFQAYLLASFLMAVLIYPVFGHWVWAGSFLPDNAGWLGRLGYVDFAGSSVVHAVGGCVALVGAWTVGPRLGRFGPDGEVREMPASNVAFSVLGVLILWFGWWGFNGGSTLHADRSVAGIIVNTNLAGAMGGFTGFLHCWLVQDKRDVEAKFLGGALGGLVAVTASCHLVSPLGALVIGALSGPIHNLAFDALLRARIDDPVGAVPVHLACGVWGILAVALFADPSRLEHGRLVQLGVQALGVAACFVWASGSAWLLYQVVRMTIGLRISPDEERGGINMAGEVHQTPAEEAVDPALLRELLGLQHGS